jgi:hypothetical protein
MVLCPYCLVRTANFQRFFLSCIVLLYLFGCFLSIPMFSVVKVPIPCLSFRPPPLFSSLEESCGTNRFLTRSSPHRLQTLEGNANESPSELHKSG